MEAFAICILSLIATVVLQESRIPHRHIPIRRFLAAIVLGTPAVLVSWNGQPLPGLLVSDPVRSLLFPVPLCLLAVAITWVLSARPEHAKQYCEPKTKIWTPRLFLFSSLAWIAYDFAYEFLFRGYLLLTLNATTGPVPAVLIVVTLYTLAHITKTTAEMLMCIPFGVLLSVITLTTGNIWPAVFIHIFLSISNEYFSICAMDGWSGNQKAFNQLS